QRPGGAGGERPARKFGDRPGFRPGGRPEGRPGGKPEGRPFRSPEGRPTGRPEGRPARSPEGRPAGRPEGRPFRSPEGRPAGRPEGRPARGPEGRPGGRPEGRPAFRPAGAGTARSGAGPRSGDGARFERKGQAFARMAPRDLSPVEAPPADPLAQSKAPWQKTAMWCKKEQRESVFAEAKVKTAVKEFTALVQAVLDAPDADQLKDAQQAAAGYVNNHPFLRWAPVPPVK
ncbi:MAG TPA: hypothetical protein VNT75_33015, partial [Symbiobacteriaceae bacterium]|nr:hypothetical protein [Symbiobacteriaceae bacterium]